jgi:septal ring factor EnvC (AmiA/AmiB activator)
MGDVQLDKRFTIGNAITVAVLIVSLLYYFFGIETTVEKNRENIAVNEQDIVELTQKINRNQDGTQNLNREIEDIKQTQKSILKLNKLIADKMGIVYVIDVSE